MKRYKMAVRFFVFLLVLQMLLPFPVFADTIGKFNEIKGDVSLNRAKARLKPDVGDNIQTKDIIYTGDQSRARLLLADDSILRMGPKSHLEITEFLLEKNKRKSVVSLKAGNLYTKVEKFLDSNSNFEVRTPTAVAGARGTAWLTVVEVVNNIAQSSIYALEQTVAVMNPLISSQVVAVTAGNFTTVVAGMAPTIPAAFTPAVIQGVMGQIGASMPAGTGTAGATGTGAAGAGAAGAGAGAGVGAGIGAGTVAAGIAGAAAVAAGVAAITSGSSSTETHTTTSNH
ncbi:MAG: FecR family protein [Proteobacteria bacterium]|nr:FecR family protein [Pseudomonadota bacterium]